MKVFRYFLLFLFTPIAMYASVPVALPAQGTANGTVGGLTQASSIASPMDASVTWQISDLGNGTYHYLYNFNASSGNPMTNVFLQLGSSITSGNFNTNITNLTSSQGSPPTGPGIVDPTIVLLSGVFGGMPAPTTGMMFSNNAGGNVNAFTNLTVSFDSPLAPYWGDLYIADSPSCVTLICLMQGGRVLNGYAYNSLYTTVAQSNMTDFTGWVPVAGDPLVPVPEPNTVWILGSFAIALFLFKHKNAILA